MEAFERFLDYISFPTMSDENSDTSPSTSKQLVLQKHIKQELISLGLKNVNIDKKGYLFADLPASSGREDLPGVIYIAHVDTALEAPDGPMHASVRQYDGGDIILNDSGDIVLSPRDFPELASYAGQRVIVTDGKTLLGADDKAGVAEIVTAAQRIIEGGIPHGPIQLCFMPDEEIGRGGDLCDMSEIHAGYGYTVDGGPVGEINYENFNAARAEITIHGTAVHPGSAKGKMKNASTLAMEFDSLLPDERPENTEGYEGFYHLLAVFSKVERARMSYIIRDHDKEKFAARKALAAQAAQKLNEKYGPGTAEADIKDSYFNMRDIMQDHMEIVERAERAMLSCGVTPVIKPIRGGTDGAVLTLRGLPCPNLCTGGENFHSRYEYITVEALDKCTDIIFNLMKAGD